MIMDQVQYPKNDLNVYDKNQRILSSPCLPIPAFGFDKARMIRTLI